MTHSAGGRIAQSPRTRWGGRAALALAVSMILALLSVAIPSSAYELRSLSSSAGTLADLGVTPPAVSRSGAMVLAAPVLDPASGTIHYVVFTGDGVQLQPLVDLTAALGAGVPASLAINDAGMVAIHYTRGTETFIVRVASDGALVVMARGDQLGSAPFLDLAPSIAMNATGQIAARATNPDATVSILRLDDVGVIEIARSGPALLDLSGPALDAAGLVAFTARPSPTDPLHVYTGSGDALSDEGTLTGCAGPSGQAPAMNDNGLVLADCGGLPLFTAHGGVVTVVVDGSEDPIFGRLMPGYALDTSGQPVFMTGVAGGTDTGVFTGNHPGTDAVVRTGDVVLGGTVEHLGLGPFSTDAGGRIALLVQIAGTPPATHVALATPSRVPQTITFAELASLAFGASPFAVAASASSGLPVTLGADGTCSIAGGVVTLLGAGTCTITASQAGDATYLPAADVTRAFSILRGPQTITFDPIPDVAFGTPPFVVSASATSGLPVSLTAGGACSIAGSLVTLIGAGPCTVIAAQGGNADYEPAGDVLRTITIARAAQSITFAPLSDRTSGDPAFPLSASASSGLPVSFAAAGTCAVAGATVVLSTGGSCTVTASQGGNADYEPAPDVARTFIIAAAAQTITFDALSDRTFDDPPVPLVATASSGLPVTFAVTGEACALDGTTVVITGAGTCTVTASQAGDASYLPAPSVARSFAVSRAPQTIAFPPLGSHRLGDAPFAVSATASSGLPVTFFAAGACTISGTLVTVTAPGACTITATQDGNASIAAAAPVARTLSVSGVLIDARFDLGPDGFAYVDNAFRAATQSAYASGAWIASGGYRGGALRVTLGGIDNNTVVGMSGGWRATFQLAAPTRLILYLRGNLTQSPSYEADEKSELLVSVDGVLRGVGSGDFLAQLVGDGNSGSSISTGWQLYSVNLGTLAEGLHTLVIGGYNGKKTEVSETTTVLIDEVLLTEGSSGAQAAVASLDFQRFKENIRVLSDFGDRTQGSPSYAAAASWLEAQLTAAGYKVEHHRYTYNNQPRDSIYVTKVGTLFPDQMYIVSAHLDGRGGGGAANDNASGCSLVLESAQALAGLTTAASVRFIFWNNEETGLNGSTAYVNTRRALQGVENPVGSGVYPEPRWLGMIQHDQILFDHGLPPLPEQIPNADLDIEYQASSSFAAASLQLATALRNGNRAYSTDYPAQVGSNMNYTDSVPFQNYTATVSVRDNQRVAEIGNGSNPHWHQPTDVYAAFSEADFRLGFNAVQMTLGTVAELAGAMTPPAQP